MKQPAPSPENMSREEVMAGVQAIVMKQLDLTDKARVAPEVHIIADLGVDSLDIVEMSMDIDETFGIDTEDIGENQSAQNPELKISAIVDNVISTIAKKQQS